MTLAEAIECLMIATVLISYWPAPDIGPISGTVVNQVIALIIAVIKAYLVVTIFMGVKWVTPLTRMWAMAGFVWFTLIYMIMGDYISRKYEPLNTWQPVPQSGMPRMLHNGSPFDPMDPNAANLHPRETSERRKRGILVLEIDGRNSIPSSPCRDSHRNLKSAIQNGGSPNNLSLCPLPLAALPGQTPSTDLRSNR